MLVKILDPNADPFFGLFNDFVEEYNKCAKVLNLLESGELLIPLEEAEVLSKYVREYLQNLRFFSKESDYTKYYSISGFLPVDSDLPQLLDICEPYIKKGQGTSIYVKTEDGRRKRRPQQEIDQDIQDKLQVLQSYRSKLTSENEEERYFYNDEVVELKDFLFNYMYYPMINKLSKFKQDIRRSVITGGTIDTEYKAVLGKILKSQLEIYQTGLTNLTGFDPSNYH